ncbi:hypothetical protein HZC21_00995 [Candidatus Peregrinibacteria bacterium]|nr:hypothetical protein [Candidatus Peregrinibacteria bacterium]
MELLQIFLKRAGEAQRQAGLKIPIIKPVADALSDTPEEKSWKRKIEYLESLREKIR